MYHLNFRERANTENMHRYTDVHVRLCKDRQHRPRFSDNKPTHGIHLLMVTVERAPLSPLPLMMAEVDTLPRGSGRS